MKKSKKNLMIVLSSLLMLGMVSGCSLQGPKGDKGDVGEQGVPGLDGSDGKNGETPYIGSNGNWWIGNNDTGVASQGPKGDKGDEGKKGDAGKDGVSIVSVTKASSVDGVDAYLIQYSDGTTSSFVVTNGKDGSQGVQGVPGADGHTPTITIGENGHWFVDGVDTGCVA